MIEIKRWDNEEVIHSGNFKSVKECLEDGVRKGISFYRAFLYKADLEGANLYMASLFGAKLQGAKLQGADLYKADLTEADLQGANLEGANLDRAIMIGANLEGANLDGANLDGANLDGAILAEAKGILQFGPMASSGRLAYAVNFGDNVKIQAGCFWDTTDVLRAKVKNDPKRQDYLLLCDWAEKRFLGDKK